MLHFTTVFLPKVFIFFHVHQMYLLHWGPYVWYVVEQVSVKRLEEGNRVHRAIRDSRLDLAVRTFFSYFVMIGGQSMINW
jgi:hypothetical protein